MDERLFINKDYGNLIWESRGSYYYYEPKKLPIAFKESLKLTKQAEKTVLALGELNGISHKFSEEEILLLRFPLMLKEATLSSEIEGTRSTIADMYKEEKIEEKDKEKKLDNQEVRNYSAALNYLLNNNQNGITEDIIKKAHKILLDGVRGVNKSPGEYKTNQNGIGNRLDTLDIAKFVPASPQTTPTLMKNLVDFMNSDEYSSLFKIAIAHYQFETIHPFRDGNGRVGRLLIMLQICKDGILSHPLLYISEYFNRNRDTYTETLFNVSSRGDVESWLLFFLKALEYQAKQTISLLKKLEEYKKEIHSKITTFSKSPNMHKLIEHIFQHPFINAKDVMVLLDISQPSAWELIKKLKNADILREEEATKEGKNYSAYKITNISMGIENSGINKP
jgi:Fic family protein